MHRHQQRMLFLSQLRQSPSDQRPSLQIERLSRLLLGQPLKLSPCVRFPSQVVLPQLKASIHRPDDLLRMSVNLSEGRPQRFVPHHDPIQRSPQRLPIQFSSQSQPARDVIGLARPPKLRQEPQPLLRIREFQPLAAIHHCDRRRLGLRRALDLPR
jgi:hypothetical protein